MQKGKMGRTCLALLMALMALGASEGSCLASDEPLTEEEIDAALADGYFVTAVKACMGGSEPPETVTLWIGIDHQGKAHVQGMNPTPNNSMVFNCIMATGNSLEFRPTGTTTRVSCELSTSTGLITEIEIQGVGFEGVEEIVDPQYEKLKLAGRLLVGISIPIAYISQVFLPFGAEVWDICYFDSEDLCPRGHKFDIADALVVGIDTVLIAAGIPVLMSAILKARSLTDASRGGRDRAWQLLTASGVFYVFALSCISITFGFYLNDASVIG